MAIDSLNFGELTRKQQNVGYRGINGTQKAGAYTPAKQIQPQETATKSIDYSARSIWDNLDDYNTRISAHQANATNPVNSNETKIASQNGSIFNTSFYNGGGKAPVVDYELGEEHIKTIGFC